MVLCTAPSTPGFDALGFVFRVRADDPRLTRHFADLFAGLATSGPDVHHYAFGAIRAPEGEPRYELTLDGHRLSEAPMPEQLVSGLVHDVNRRAIEGCDGLMLHAAGVEHDGMGLILPAQMDAGKTTLVAGLVRAGLGYLTDEAVALDRETLLIRPYPKPLSLDPGAWPLFPELEPQVDLPTDGYKTDQWQVAPATVGPGALGRSCPVGVVVFPRFEPGSDTALEPLSRAEALVELAKNTFQFKDQGRAALDLLAEVARPAVCHRLTMGDLDQAVALVSGLVGASATGRRAS